MVKIIKAPPTCFGSHKTIIREPHPVLTFLVPMCVLLTTRTLIPDM